MSKRSPDEGRFSKVTRRMWNDERFRRLSAPRPSAQVLWFRLLTGPELGAVPGLFPAREGGLADALGWPLAALRRCWKEIEREELARADWKAGVVWVPKAIEHNPPQATNSVYGWQLAIQELPECSLKQDALADLRVRMTAAGEPWAKAFAVAMREASREPTEEPSPKPSDKPSPKASDKPSDMVGADHAASRTQDAGEKREEKIPPPPSAKPPDRFLGSFSRLRPDVAELHEAYKATFGLSGHVLTGASDLNATTLGDAIDLHGLPLCLAMLRVAKSDRMVNGEGDDKGMKHEKISYLFGNSDTVARLIRLAEQAAKAERKPDVDPLRAAFAAEAT